jgi:hypothetical protein
VNLLWLEQASSTVELALQRVTLCCMHALRSIQQHTSLTHTLDVEHILYDLLFSVVVAVSAQCQ